MGVVLPTSILCATCFPTAGVSSFLVQQFLYFVRNSLNSFFSCVLSPSALLTCPCKSSALNSTCCCVGCILTSSTSASSKLPISVLLGMSTFSCVKLHKWTFTFLFQTFTTSLPTLNFFSGL